VRKIWLTPKLEEWLFDARQASDEHRRLKALAQGRGWWVPSGVNENWRLNAKWVQYYERKRSQDSPPVLKDDESLIAEARSRGIPTPLANSLNNRWRRYLMLQIAKHAIRQRERARQQIEKGRGKPKHAWTKKKLKQDDENVKRRNTRRAKATGAATKSTTRTKATNSLQQQQPWRKLNMSRATWFRRRREGVRPTALKARKPSRPHRK
jgi:hypothetical protein